MTAEKGHVAAAAAVAAAGVVSAAPLPAALVDAALLRRSAAVAQLHLLMWQLYCLMLKLRHSWMPAGCQVLLPAAPAAAAAAAGVGLCVVRPRPVLARQLAPPRPVAGQSWSSTPSPVGHKMQQALSCEHMLKVPVLCTAWLHSSLLQPLQARWLPCLLSLHQQVHSGALLLTLCCCLA